MKRIIVVIVLFIFIFTGCGKTEHENTGLNAIKSYEDIPSITQEEISAIEKLKKSRDGTVEETNEYGRKYIGIKIGDDIRPFYSDLSEREEIIKAVEEHGGVQLKK